MSVNSVTHTAAVNRVTTAEKQLLALDLRRQKKTLQEIGDILGCSKVYALRLVNQALTKIAEETKESAERYRALQTLRLEQLLDAWEEPALTGTNDKAATVYLRTLDQLSRLYALYPTAEQSAAQAGTTINVIYANDNRQITLSNGKQPNRHEDPHTLTLPDDTSTDVDHTA